MKNLYVPYVESRFNCSKINVTLIENNIWHAFEEHKVIINMIKDTNHHDSPLCPRNTFSKKIHANPFISYPAYD